MSKLFWVFVINNFPEDHLMNSWKKHISSSAIVCLTIFLSFSLTINPLHAADSPSVSTTPDCMDDNVVPADVATGEELQRVLDRCTGQHRCVRLVKPATITCSMREDVVRGEKSLHALLVPEQVRLDLNGSTLRLDMRSNGYGVRLCNNSAISNGTIKIVASEGKGSQSIWHCAVSVGAAYGDGGIPEKPSYFSKVSNWVIEKITIDQPIAAACIQLMSEACHGTIRDIRILDSNQALLGIGLDWGTVGPISAEDAQIPRMKTLWEQGKIYSTHPHDVLIERIRIGKLLRNVDANDAGVRLSACHNITVRDVQIEAAASAVMIVGGDCGYEYSRPDQRPFAHQGYRIERVTIDRALRFGLVFNGLADNVWRATKKFGYVPVLDPAHPGLDRLIVNDVTLHGAKVPQSQGIYAVALSGAELDNLRIDSFTIGVHVEDWVRGMSFKKTEIRETTTDKLIQGATEPATGVVFE